MIHKLADCQAQVPVSTNIWQFCVVLPDAKIGENCNICSHCFIENGAVIGNNVTIKNGVQVWDGITIEDNVFVGSNVTLGNDRFPKSRNKNWILEKTIIKQGASIGGGSTIRCGVTIGENALIGAGSVVTKDVPAGEVWVGNPAHRLGKNIAKLLDDMRIEKYGLSCRLVREEDAEFIVKLRTDERNARFIHATDVSVEKQVEWIKQYKEREAKGEDYYFIFYAQDQPVGLIRIYDIDYEAKKATAGSWVCAPNLPIQIPISVLISCREIMFDILGVEKDCFDVRKANKQVLRLHKMTGAEIVAEDELNYYFELPKEVFEEKKHEIINLLSIE